MEKRSSAKQTEESSHAFHQPRRRGRGPILQGVGFLLLAAITAILAISGGALWVPVWLLPTALGAFGLIGLLIGLTRYYSGPKV